MILTLAACGLAWPVMLQAQQEPAWEMEALSDAGGVIYDFQTGIATATNGVLIKYAGAILTADRVMVDQASGEVMADGQVRVQRDDQVWASEHISYNFKTRQMRAEQFRTGRNPVFAGGLGLGGDVSNRVYTATNAVITTEDNAEPVIKIRASSIKIFPGDKVVARHAWLYLGVVPVFYFPYYSQSLTVRGNNFNFVPGYRSRYGPYVLGSYTWAVSESLEAVVHADYRVRRGFGGGPDVNYNFGRWGQGTAKYYYLYDQDPEINNKGYDIPNNRQRVWFSYQANPATNLTLKSMVRYQTDSRVIHDFFDDEYRENPQPSTYVEVNQAWRNFSLDVLAQPRLNDFLETVERLPDVRLTGFRQQVGATPVFYESESSFGYYRHLFPETNGIPYGLKYEASRADTWHQLLIPWTLMGWLNITPRAGGRLTYYTEADGPGATTAEETRGVFNTGGEVSFKASRLWAGASSKMFQVDGLRHIFEPAVNYVYVPNPSEAPGRLPQFDYELPSLMLLPIDFPHYNSIDSIDSENVVRLGVRNKLQTKRQREIVNLVDWDLFVDWRLSPESGQTEFSDLSSDFSARPRSWLLFESLTRYDFDRGQFRMAFNSATFQPNDVWSWTVGQFYLRDNYQPAPEGWGQGNNGFMSSILYRFNQNWAVRATQYYDAREGQMEEQSYTVYRDLRSWTAALSFRLRNQDDGENDFTVAFTFSLKAFPRYPLGKDVLRPYSLLE